MTRTIPAIRRGHAPAPPRGKPGCGCPVCRRRRQRTLEMLIEDGLSHHSDRRLEPFDDFGFDAALDRETAIRPAGQPTPGHYYAIKRGDTLLGVAGRAYGLGQGPERLAAAQRINDADYNRRFRKANLTDKGLFPHGRISYNPRFSCDLKEQARNTPAPRGKCFATIWIPPRDSVIHPVLGKGQPVPATYLHTDDLPLPELTPEDVGTCSTGELGRHPVPDSKVPPFRWICSIETIFVDPDNQFRLLTFGYAATGVLISSRHVLTAAHCLAATIEGSKGTKKLVDALHVRIIPGMNAHVSTSHLDAIPVQFREFHPSSSEAKKIFRQKKGHFVVPQAWRESQDPCFDYCLIRLPVDLATIGWWGSSTSGHGTIIQPIKKATLERRSLRMVGYPLDKQLHKGNILFFQQWSSTGEGRIRAYADYVAKLWPESQKEGERYKDHRMITYDACGIRGNSGSPVWIKMSKGQLNLIGIHTTGVHTEKFAPYDFAAAVRITPDVLTELRHWQETM